MPLKQYLFLLLPSFTVFQPPWPSFRFPNKPNRSQFRASAQTSLPEMLFPTAVHTTFKFLLSLHVSPSRIILLTCQERTLWTTCRRTCPICLVPFSVFNHNTIIISFGELHHLVLSFIKTQVSVCHLPLLIQLLTQCIRHLNSIYWMDERKL